MWKCKNPDCAKTFPVLAKLSVEKKPTSFTSENVRIITEKACCPYCESTVIELVEENKGNQPA